MKLTFRKIIFMVLLIIFLFAFTLSSYASTDVLDVYAPSCILINMNTGNTIYSKNADEKMYPASITKVMTAILTLENCKLDEKVTISHSAIFNVPSGYANAALVEGEELTVYQLLNVLLIPSANDAAYALAEHIGGSVENFSKMMNEKAKKIGCKNTNFVNPNGIHDDNHYSTASDLALIGLYAMKNSTFRKIVATTKYTLPTTNKYDKTDRIFNTTNELIKTNSKYYYEYATGCKTGYTEPAKNCIIATAKKDNVEFLCVILHDQKLEDGSSARELDCKTLFDYAFNTYSLVKLASKDDLIQSITVPKATLKTRKLDLKLSDDIYVITSKNIKLSNIIPEIVLSEDLEAPFLENATVGQVNYTVDNFTYSADLLATHDVYRSNMLLVAIWILGIIVVLFVFSSFIKFLRLAKSRKKNSHVNYYNNQKRKK